MNVENLEKTHALVIVAGEVFFCTGREKMRGLVKMREVTVQS